MHLTSCWLEILLGALPCYVRTLTIIRPPCCEASESKGQAMRRQSPCSPSLRAPCMPSCLSPCTRNSHIYWWDFRWLQPLSITLHPPSSLPTWGYRHYGTSISNTGHILIEILTERICEHNKIVPLSREVWSNLLCNNTSWKRMSVYKINYICI